jgi:hypothetical protein
MREWMQRYKQLTLQQLYTIVAIYVSSTTMLENYNAAMATRLY